MSIENETTVDIQISKYDYVLVRKEENITTQSFEDNLKNKGLKLEGYQHDKVYFVAILATEEVLQFYCEIMKLHIPLKNVNDEVIAEEPTSLLRRIYKFFDRLGFHRHINPHKKYHLTREFSRSHKDLFIEEIFTPSVKCMIINFILSKTKFETETPQEIDHIGIDWLIEEKIYESAYPLHDDSRHELLKNWASLKKLTHPQPVDAIKDYFGIKIALYYTWIGFYSYMLVPASIFGIICMLHGISTYIFRRYKFEACDEKNNFVMCPLCDNLCDYWYLEDTCSNSIITYVFDNSSTVFFATVMTLWSAVYLSFWKRISNELLHRWGVATNIILDGQTTLKKSINEKIQRIPKLFFSCSIVLLWICIVMAVMLALMFYRVSLTAAETLFGKRSTTFKGVFVTVTGSLMDFISILICNYFFEKVAEWLTRRERHQNRVDFENNLAWKMYLFWFVNYYSAMFYIAFIKGRFVGRPGAYIRLFGLRQEECGPGGCMLDLFIQLVVVMVGDITFNNVLEYLVPYVRSKMKAYKSKPHDNKSTEAETNCLTDTPSYVKDDKLLKWQTIDMVNEYLDMVLQYGFVTLFVCAFPLAPLFALINNIFEIRMDAKKLFTNYRRPVAQIAKDIGIWLWIMDFIAKLSILTNACIIAFTSNFIPQLVYITFFNSDHKSRGFLNYSLSYFDVNDFEKNTVPTTQLNVRNLTYCRYPGYRNPPWVEDKYNISIFYWYVLAARLIFIVLFQNVIVVLKMFIKWFLPDIPAALNEHIHKELKKTQMNLMKQQNVSTSNPTLADSSFQTKENSENSKFS